MRIPHAEFVYKFACLVKSHRLAWHAHPSHLPLSPGQASGGAAAAAGGAGPGEDYGRWLTSQLSAVWEDNPLAEAELKKRSLAFVAELGLCMPEVVNKKSTQVGNTKVFMKATFAYTLHRIAEITEDHCIRKIQRQVSTLTT